MDKRFIIERLNNDKRLDWDEYFSLIAILTSQRSPCNRLKVGCIIVKDRRIISTSYNGYLPNCKHESIVVNDHEQAIVHAEQNAIADSAKRGVNLYGATAYITHYPCLNCFKILAASGIKEIKYLNDYKNNDINKKLLENGVKINITKVSF
jgi:dCMP deaminase